MHWTDVIRVLTLSEADWHPIATAKTIDHARYCFEDRHETFRRHFKRKLVATHPDRGGDPKAFIKAQEAWDAMLSPGFVESLWKDTASLRMLPKEDRPPLLRSSRRLGFVFGDIHGMRTVSGGVFSALKRSLK